MGNVLFRQAVCVCPSHERRGDNRWGRRYPAGKCDVCEKPNIKGCCEDTEPSGPCGLPAAMAKLCNQDTADEHVEQIISSQTSRPTILLKRGSRLEKFPAEYSMSAQEDETIFFTHENDYVYGKEVSVPTVVNAKTVQDKGSTLKLSDEAVKAFCLMPSGVQNIDHTRVVAEYDGYSPSDHSPRSESEWYVPRFITTITSSKVTCVSCGTVVGSRNCSCASRGSTDSDPVMIRGEASCAWSKATKRDNAVERPVAL